METPDKADQRLIEAADWFEQKREGRLDQQAFDLWMKDSRNMEAWLHTLKGNEGLQTVRGGVELLREVGLGLNPGPPANDVEPPSTVPKPEPKSSWQNLDRRTVLYWLGGIGGITALGASAFIATAKESAQTSVGMQRLVTLPDGAILDLNTDSRALWRMNAKTRDVWLERGEMALSARNASRPFVLRNEGDAVMALSDGEINVRRMGKSLNVTVVTGAAVIAKQADGVVHLTPGTLLTSGPSSRQLRALPPIQTEKAVLWKQRQVSFDGETLAQAVAEFNRYLPNKIKVTDPSLNSLHILATGNWRVDAPEDFLDSLTDSFDLSIKREQDGGYLVEKKTANP